MLAIQNDTIVYSIGRFRRGGALEVISMKKYANNIYKSLSHSLNMTDRYAEKSIRALKDASNTQYIMVKNSHDEKLATAYSV